MDFVDLNVAKPELSALLHKLGFSQSFSLQSVAVNSQADIQKRLNKPSAVESTNVELLMAACRNQNAILINPFLAKGFEREQKLFRKIAEEGKFLEIPLSLFLDCSGARRAGRLHVATKAARLALKHKARIVITSRAASQEGCKSPHEICSLAESFLAMSPSAARDAISKNPIAAASENGLSPL